MDRVTRAKIESLIHEIRSWSPETDGGGLETLARRFQLDPMIVARVAEAEGVTFSDEPEVEADPNQSTQVMSLDDVHRES